MKPMQATGPTLQHLSNGPKFQKKSLRRNVLYLGKIIHLTCTKIVTVHRIHVRNYQWVKDWIIIESSVLLSELIIGHRLFSSRETQHDKWLSWQIKWFSHLLVGLYIQVRLIFLTLKMLRQTLPHSIIHQNSLSSTLFKAYFNSGKHEEKTSI